MTTCLPCTGSGYIDEELCETCFGAGITPVKGVYLHTVKKLVLLKEGLDALNNKVDDMIDTLNDVIDKLDDILEQLNP